MTKQEFLLNLGVDKIPVDSEAKLERILRAFNDAEIQDVISTYNRREMSLSDFIRESYFSAKIGEIKAQRQIDELKAKMPKENETAKSLDILGTALVEAMKQTKGQELIEFAKEFIKSEYGITEKKVVLVNAANGKRLEGIHHEKFQRVANYINCGFNVMLVGPAGTGKNVLCKQVAEFLGYEYFQANAVQQTYQLDGFIDANGTYQDTEFYKACKSASEGKDVLFVFDEIDGSNAEVMVRFNDALSSYKLEFPVETLDFRGHMHFVSCANTWGTGASFEYVGRNQLDAATLNRWVNVEIDYSPAVEEAICDDSELLEFCRAFRNAIRRNNIQHIVSYRDIERLSTMFKVEGMKDAETLKECLTKNLEANDLSMIVRELPNGQYRKMVEELINA